MPLHERRTVFVEIDGGRGNGIFGVVTIWKFIGLLKDPTGAMRLDQRLQQELDNFRMQVAAYQYLSGGSYEWHVNGRDVSVNINNTSRQHQPNEFRKYDRERLRHWKAHEPDGGIYQHGMNSYAIGRAEDPHGVHLAITECFGRCRSCERHEDRVFRNSHRLCPEPVRQPAASFFRR